MTDASQAGPWYRHSWPWFIVILLSTTVVSGIATVVIAVRGADPLVTEDSYRKGQSINQTLAADHEAALREAAAQVTLDGGVTVALNILGEFPAALELDLSHVTRTELDRRLHLERAPDGRYASAENLPAGRFYATLRPAGEGATWRLRSRVELPEDRSFRMEPGG